MSLADWMIATIFAAMGYAAFHYYIAVPMWPKVVAWLKTWRPR
jgi:hypothetical protein